MQVSNSPSLKEAKAFVVQMKKKQSVPKFKLIYKNPQSKAQEKNRFILEVDFNSQSTIIEEDIINILNTMKNSNILDAMILKISPTTMNLTIAKVLNEMILNNSKKFENLNIVFIAKKLEKNVFLKDFFSDWRVQKPFLRDLKISFQCNLIEESWFEGFLKELSLLDLHELSLNLNFTKITKQLFLKISPSLKKNSSLKNLSIFARCNNLSLQKEDLVLFFKTLNSLKSLNSIHLDFKSNEIQLIDIVYLLRKFLKVKNFPYLEAFHLNANHLKFSECSQNKLMYYLQRKATSFKKDPASHPLKDFTFKLKENLVKDDNLIFILGFLKNMNNLSSFTLLLKGNKISFLPYLQFLFQININTIKLDYFQQMNQSLGNFSQNSEKKMVKSVFFKGHFNNKILFELFTKYLKNLINIENLDLQLTCDSVDSFEKKWGVMIMNKTLTKLKTCKLHIISRDNGFNFVGVKTFFTFLMGLRILEKCDIMLSIQPNLNLNEFLVIFAECFSKLKFLNTLSIKFVSLLKTPMDQKTIRMFGQAFLNSYKIRVLKTDDMVVNRVFLLRLRFLLIALSLNKELRQTFKRRNIIEEILFYFLN